MAEYLDDFENVVEVFEVDGRPYLLEYTDIPISQWDFSLSGTWTQ